MRKNVLICTLGETPPVVTEAIDLLKRRGIQINEVILLTTKDSLAEESADFLINHIYKRYRGQVNAFTRYIEAYNDIIEEKAVVEFMIKACGVLRGKIQEGSDVYVNIAGGRKTMSALMTLAVQFYGAKELIHIIINDEELEKKSQITYLRHLEKEEELNKILYPDLSLIYYVRMPFIGLFPWMSDILKVLKGGKTEKKEVNEFMINSNLIENGKPTDSGNLILKILESVELRPDPYLQEAEIKISAHHYKKELEEKAQKIKNRINYVCRITSADWREGREKVIKVPPDKLKVFIDLGKGFNVGLLLETTAKTDGQLTIAAREVEEILEKL